MRRMKWGRIISGICCILIMACEGTEIISDVQKIAALEKVKIKYDGMDYEIGLPPGATSGQSLAVLMIQDSSEFKNPANYSISMSLDLTVDNTASDASDAKFDGVSVNMVLDTINSEPVQLANEGFEVEKGMTYPTQMEAEINLQTHRQAGLYIFRQTVDGSDISTRLRPALNYNFGIKQGAIEFLELQKDIPTRASEETKDFLRQLLDSGILDQD